MPKESRAAVQICSCIAPDDVAGLYALASDGSVWKYCRWKDLDYWDPLEPLPGEDPATALDPGEVDSTRHRILCDALQQLGPGIVELTTQEVVSACRKAVADASSDEILAALRAVGRPV